MKPKASLRFLLGCPIIALLAATSSSAQNHYWDSDGNTAGFGNTTGTWGTNAFWTTVAGGGATHSAVTNLTTAHTANFGSATLNYGNATVGIAAGGVAATSIVFGAGQSTALTIGSASSGTITLGGTTRTIIANSSGHSILAPIELTGATIVRLAYQPPSAAATSLTLGSLSGTGGVTFENTAGGNPNPATFVLKGASNYSGNTILQSTVTNAGVELRLDVDDALPTTTVLNLQGAAGPAGGSNRNTSLNLNGSDQTLAGLSNSGGGSLRTFRVFSSSAATLTINDSGSRTFSGLIGNGGTNIAIVKEGDGIWTLSGANTYAGLTTIDGGAIRVQNATALGGTMSGTVVNGTGTADTANARLELAGGVTVSGESLTISGVGNFNGALTSTSGNNIWAGNVTIGAAGTRIGASAGTSLQVSGTIDSGLVNTGLIIRTADLTGTVILSGANTYLGSTQVLIGKLQLAGGDNRLPVGTNLSFNSGGTNPDAEFDLNGRNQEVAGLSLGGAGIATKNSVNNSSVTLSTLTVNTAASPSAYGGILKGNLGLTKEGANSLTLTGTNNNYTGETDVNDGTLIVNGNISTSVLTTVQSGATLGGTGTIGAATINGVLAPGNSIGTLEATGDVTWNDNDAWVFELGSAAGTLALADSTSGLSDLLNITGVGSDFLKGTGSSFTFSFAGGGEAGWYKLVDWTGTTDFIASDFFATNLGDGLTGTFTVDGGTSALYLNVVPEPRAALLGALGMLGLLRRRRI